MSKSEKSESRNYIPVVGKDQYKVILHPATQYDTVRRNTVFKDLGISYVYGVNETDLGYESEVVEVWFVRTKWTAAGVIGWMQEHGESLPAPSRARTPPPGEPVLSLGPYKPLVSLTSPLLRSPACRQKGESKAACVSRKIPELRKEGYPQKQAVAIANSMCGKACK